MRAAPAALAAVALRVGGSAPPLVETALLTAAAADAVALDGAEPAVGGSILQLLSELLLAAALWELASPALLARAPWRAAGAGAELALFAALAAGGRRPRGQLAALAPIPPLLLAAAALAAGLQALPGFAGPMIMAVAAATAAVALDWLRRPTLGLGRPERALRSLAALALAWPFAAPLWR